MKIELDLENIRIDKITGDGEGIIHINYAIPFFTSQHYGNGFDMITHVYKSTISFSGYGGIKTDIINLIKEGIIKQLINEEATKEAEAENL